MYRVAAQFFILAETTVEPFRPSNVSRRKLGNLTDDDLDETTELGIMNFGNFLHWAVVFLVVAIIAALLGFGGVAGTAMEGARMLFWVALVLLVISLVLGLIRRG